MIALVDCNNFFVSCERVFRPDLLKKPVVVLSSNDGCVVARSEEVKDRGIPMGVPYFQIKDILAEMGASVFSSNFGLYKDISRRVFDVVKSELTKVEQYSIDECFIELSKSEVRVLDRLRDRIQKEVGVPVSIGMAPSKTIAKYLTRIAKKTKKVEVFDSIKWSSDIYDISLSQIWGVGSARGQEFKKAGLVTVSDLLKLETNRVSSVFGVEGVRLQAELKGQSVNVVSLVPTVAKSIMSSRSFAKEIKDYSGLEKALYGHLYSVVADLERQSLFTANIKVFIAPSRHSDYFLAYASKEVTFDLPTRDIFTLKRCLEGSLREIFVSGVPYKRAGIIVSKLSSSLVFTESLLERADLSIKTEVLTKTILNLNTRYGVGTVTLGEIKSKELKGVTRSEFISPAYTTDWSEVLVVKA